jgi:zinc protease
MRKIVIIISVLFFFAIPDNASAVDINEYVLDNGLKVLILEDHTSPTATFQIWYRVGSRHETIGKTGLSHLLEHMMFKGTERFGPKTFSQTIKRAGGIDNAFTSREYTGYFELISADHIELPIELEADRMKNIILMPNAVLSERDVVMEERRLRYEDDPQNLVFEEVIATAFKSHPYRWPVIGWMSDLEDLNPEDLINYYKTHYVPNNAVAIIVGDVNSEEVMTKIENTFGKIDRGAEIRDRVFEETEQRGEKRVYVKKEAELPFILMAYKVPNIESEDSYALEVLGAVLSEGKSSRLYKSLVYEKQLTLSAWASYSGLYIDPFLFFIGATPALGITTDEVESTLLAEIDKISKEPPSEREVQKAKNQIEASFVMEQDSIYMQARTIGTFELIGGWKLIDKYLEGIRKVTPDDVRAVAKKYLVPDGKTTGILIPLGSKKADD